LINDPTVVDKASHKAAVSKLTFPVRSPLRVILMAMPEATDWLAAERPKGLYEGDEPVEGP